MVDETTSGGAGKTGDDEQLLSPDDLRALMRSSRNLTKEVGLETLLDAILETAGRLTDSAGNEHPAPQRT